METPGTRHILRGHILALTIDAKDRLYFASSHQINEVNVSTPSTISTYTSTSSEGAARAIACDRNGNLIVGVSSGIREYSRVGMYECTTPLLSSSFAYQYQPY
jgi:ligand-binding sensor domain-containing protein